MHLSLTKYSRNFELQLLLFTTHYAEFAEDVDDETRRTARPRTQTTEGWAKANKRKCLCFRTDYYVIIHPIDDLPFSPEP